jgi:hypothetical protein
MVWNFAALASWIAQCLFLKGTVKLGNFATGPKISHTSGPKRSKGCMDAAESGGYVLHDAESLA